MGHMKDDYIQLLKEAEMIEEINEELEDELRFQETVEIKQERRWYD